MAIAESSKEPGYGEENISGPGSRQVTFFHLLKNLWNFSQILTYFENLKEFEIGVANLG